MRIATWNVNSLNARLAYVLDFLRTRSPDVALLQELKISDDAFPWIDFESAGYHVVMHGQKSWNGVAVVSRMPVEGIQYGLPGAEELGARLVTADVAGVRAVSVYVPNGKDVVHADYPSKVKFLESLQDYVTHLAAGGEPLVIGGDFNLCPADLDSYDPVRFAGTIFHTEAERAPYRAMVEAGLVDLFRRVEPDLPGYTWWDYRAGNFHKGLGLRIDLLLASPGIASRVESARVDRDFRKKREGQTPSDHAPLIVELHD